MLIYAAGGQGGKPNHAAGGQSTAAWLDRARYPNLLIAFPYDPDIAYLPSLSYTPSSLLTDSGAWSAWTKGEKIDVKAYIEWCHTLNERHPGVARCHINLDVIPGRQGQPLTARHKREAMKRSLINGDLMRAAGLRVMEVHHQGEPLTFLDQLLERRQPGDIIGVSPRKDVAVTRRRAYVDQLLHHLTRGGANPQPLDAFPPLHGLGVSGRAMIFRYPWWSVDSSSWVAPSKFGQTLDARGQSGSDPRNRVREMRGLQIAQWLRTWEQWQTTATTLWTQRGLTHAD